MHNIMVCEARPPNWLLHLINRIDQDTLRTFSVTALIAAPVLLWPSTGCRWTTTMAVIDSPIVAGDEAVVMAERDVYGDAPEDFRTCSYVNHVKELTNIFEFLHRVT